MLRGTWSVPCTVALATFLMAGCSGPNQSDAMPMDDMDYAIPAGMGWADGNEIRFTHTEASDSALAVLLSNMMSSPVLFVPGFSGSGTVDHGLL